MWCFVEMQSVLTYISIFLQIIGLNMLMALNELMVWAKQHAYSLMTWQCVAKLFTADAPIEEKAVFEYSMGPFHRDGSPLHVGEHVHP